MKRLVGILPVSIFVLIFTQSMTFHVESQGSPPTVARPVGGVDAVWRVLRDRQDVYAVGTGVGGEVVIFAGDTFTQDDMPNLPEGVSGEEDLVIEHTDDFATLEVYDGIVEEQGGTLVDLREKVRPARGGLSIGHYKVTAGTLGAVVCDNSTNKYMLLSNNHVLGLSNDATIGDPIIQPGAYDGGVLGRDTVGFLARFVTLQTNRDNLVDAAVAWPVNESQVSSNSIKIGVVTGWSRAYPGQAVRKIGRTTEYQEGHVKAVDAHVKVQYDRHTMFEFSGQIILDAHMVAGGDSGSLVVAANSQEAVGLVFAGSKEFGVANHIGDVLRLLDVRFCAKPEGAVIYSILLKYVPAK